MNRPLLVSLLLLSLVVAGCTTQQSTSPTNTTVTTTPNANTTSAAPHDISFVASQSGPPRNGTTYQFSGSDTAAAGWVTVHLQNDGLEPHQLALFALGNLSFAAFHAMLMAPPNASSNMSAGPQPAGGVAVANPGGNATTVVHLAAGEYVAVCFIPDPSGTPHAMHGMVKAVHIVNASGSPAAEPTPDTTITTMDYNFTLDHNLTSGPHIVAVKNAGPHQHEAVLIKLKGNASAMDFIHAFGPDAPPGAPPGDAVGGGAAQTSGHTEYAMLTLTPGRYALMCFEQDSESSPPHFALGMVKEFTIA